MFFPFKRMNSIFLTFCRIIGDTNNCQLLEISTLLLEFAVVRSHTPPFMPNCLKDVTRLYQLYLLYLSPMKCSSTLIFNDDKLHLSATLSELLLSNTKRRVMNSRSFELKDLIRNLRSNLGSISPK